MGAGRSGSTILGVALGNCDGVFFAGELDKWLIRRGEPQLQDPERLSFWSAVRERVEGAQELFGPDTQRYIERSSALFRRGGRRRRRDLRGTYRALTERLYRAVAETSGASVVVDTGHYPLRARELQHSAEIDLRLIWLVRDAHRVVASFDRDDVAERRFSPATTNAYLWLTNLLSLAVFLRQPRERRLLVRHEDFLTDPAGVLARILAWAGGPASTPDLSALSTGLPFQGNRLTRTSVVSLRHDEASAPRRRLALTSLAQAPWRAVFSAIGPRAAVSG